MTRIFSRLYFILISIILLSPIVGELFRFQFGSFDLLPSDLALLILVFLWIFDKFFLDRKFRIGKIGYAVILFLFYAVFNYLIQLFRFDLVEMKFAFLYLGRIGLYFLFMPILYDIVSRKKDFEWRNKILILSGVTTFLITLFGFLQLKWFPDFLALGLHLDGWDPHIGRLVSTWMDPNFIGGYLAFKLCIILGVSLYFLKKKDYKTFFILSIVGFFILSGLYLTFSRSGYLALIAGVGFLALIKARKLVIIGLLVGLLAFSFSSRMQGRVLEAVDSAKGLVGLDEQKPLDPTARLRVWSWTFAGQMIEDYPWLGVGYNRYPFEINQRGHGEITDHSSGGSDSSLLTIWATMGIFGLIFYLGIAFVATFVTLKRTWNQYKFKSYLDSGILAGFVGMMIHSVFVNSLLFSFMMIYLMAGLVFLDER